MQINFHKYQATGNDFVLIDNRENIFPVDNKALFNKLCNRKFGIGADGLILLEQSVAEDFKMNFFNPDGSQSFCGNGSRTAVSFAKSLGIITDSGSFEAFDGIHRTAIMDNLIQINIADVQNGRQVLNGTFLDTGSPHYVEVVENLDKLDVLHLGKELRYNAEFEPNGSNINFVEKTAEDKIRVRTYERGVESETLSCGTGVTASAIATASGTAKISITTPGGKLRVWFEKAGNTYRDVWLEGPAEKVFEGKIDV